MSELTEILAEHLGHIEIDDDGAYWWKCNCGDESDESEIFASEQEAEEWGRTHLAEVIKASDWLRAEKAKAWDEGYAKGNLDGYYGTSDERKKNPYGLDHRKDNDDE